MTDAALRQIFKSYAQKAGDKDHLSRREFLTLLNKYDTTKLKAMNSIEEWQRSRRDGSSDTVKGKDHAYDYKEFARANRQLDGALDTVSSIFSSWDTIAVAAFRNAFFGKKREFTETQFIARIHRLQREGDDSIFRYFPQKPRP